MSDRIASKWKWGGVLLAGIAAVAGITVIGAAVYYLRNRRHSVSAPATAREQPPSSPVLPSIQQDPVIAAKESQDKQESAHLVRHMPY